MSRLPSCSAALLIACGTTGKPADPPMDADGDGFEAEEDCDDADPAVNPAAQELCNGLDDDCDGAIDIDDPDVEGTSTWSVDSDGDGFGDPTLSADGCVQPEGTADNADDCDDRDDAIHPAADETCDGVDNDCDGAVDAADEGVVGASAWAPDVDGDGFGDPTRAVDGCEPPEVGWVNNAADCDDDDPLTHPAAVETCGDGADSDCDGFDGPARFDGSGTLGCAQVWWDGADGVSGLGTDVAAAGDVDGDGLSDVVAVSNGAAWLFTAISAGGGDSSGAHIEMAPLGPGGAVAAGDLNGDAHVDVVVGDPVVGEVYLLSGSPDGGRFDPATGGALPLLATLRVPGAGGDVAVIPDHGGTGVTTVVVAGPGSDSAWMFSAPFVGVMDADMAVAEVVGAGGGITVAAIGDVDGDGKADLLAGDPEAADGDGRVLVVRDHVVRRELTGTDGERLGAAVSSAGDWNGDGRADIAVGAPASGAEAPGAGAVWIVEGGGSGMAPMADVAMAWLTGPSDQGAAGTSVASPGDINQDGYDDLLIGAPGVDGGRGAVYVVLGPVEDEASLADVAYEELGESASDAAGAAVAGPGDVDGDGVVDMLIGAPGAGGGVGCAYLYLGGGI